jgi:outer membrane protein assembly factor BamB
MKNWWLAVFLLAWIGRAADWPQWRGPERTGHVNERLETLPAEPKVLWKIDTTEGLSSPVVSRGKVFLFEAENAHETLRALNANTGERIWSVQIDDTFKDAQGPPGPRCTPVVDGDRVYAVSCRGELRCIDVANGKIIWGASYTTNFGATFIGEKGKAPGASRHGNNGSPLVVGDRLYACAGGTNGAIVCFNKKTGEVIWKSLAEPAAYSPPVILKIRDQDQLVCFMADALLAVSPADGKLLWRFPIKTDFARHVTTPVAFNDIVVVSSHQVGMVGVRVSAEGATQAWLSKESAMNFSSPVAIRNHLYGLGPKSDIICVDIPTGKQLWSKPGYFTTSPDRSEGALIAFKDNLLMLTDGGRLVLFAESPTEFHEVATAQICGLNWCNPAYVDGKLFLREGVKTTGSLMCVQIK